MIAPYGGTLVDLMVPSAEQSALKASATKTLECSDRNACDVELLVVGGFSPLRGFMHQEDYDAVVSGHRTAAGHLFGLPIVMDTDRDDVVVPEGSFAMARAIRACGGRKSRLTIYPDLGHNAWDPAYADPALYLWLLSHRRGIED